MSLVENPPSLNVTVIRATVHKLPEWRELPSGDSVTTIDVKTRYSTRSEVLRISWMNAPSTAMEFNEGEEVVVVGRVRTYWSGRRSETDVLASSVTRLKATK